MVLYCDPHPYCMNRCRFNFPTICFLDGYCYNLIFQGAQLFIESGRDASVQKSDSPLTKSPFKIYVQRCFRRTVLYFSTQLTIIGTLKAYCRGLHFFFLYNNTRHRDKMQLSAHFIKLSYWKVEAFGIDFNILYPLILSQQICVCFIVYELFFYSHSGI